MNARRKKTVEIPSTDLRLYIFLIWSGKPITFTRIATIVVRKPINEARDRESNTRKVYQKYQLILVYHVLLIEITYFQF